MHIERIESMYSSEEYLPVNATNSRGVDTSLIHDSVVKLTFKSNGKAGVGTGFFIHIPDSPYDVILTAGHNLYTHTKTYTTSITVLSPDPNPYVAAPVAIRVPPEHVKVCAAYLNDPTNPIFNYGAILIPYAGDTPRRGFGFNAIRAFSEHLGDVHLSSYRTGSYPGRPVWSTGVVLNDESSAYCLVYDATSETGGDGSPVWVVLHATEIVVVGIHIQNPTSGSTASLGLRISPELLCELYSWVGLDAKKKIKAHNLSKQNPITPPSAGLYMIFGSRPFARLRCGTGSEFNVFPVRVTATTTCYALKFGSKWVMFDVEDQKVTLVDELAEQCLFTKKTMKNPQMHPGVFYIVIRGNYLLQMDGSKFKSTDTLDAQRSGLGMVAQHDKRPFVQFIFESGTPSKGVPNRF